MDRIIDHFRTRTGMFLYAGLVIMAGLRQAGYNIRSDFRDAWIQIQLLFVDGSIPAKVKTYPHIRISMTGEEIPLHPRKFHIRCRYEATAGPVRPPQDDGFWLIVDDFCRKQVRKSLWHRQYSIDKEKGIVHFREEDDAVAFKLIMGE